VSALRLKTSLLYQCSRAATNSTFLPLSGPSIYLGTHLPPEWKAPQRAGRPFHIRSTKMLVPWQHRHEYSAPLEQRSNSIPRRNPLARSTFSSPVSRIPPTYEKPSPIIRRPERPLSEHLPRTYDQIVRFREPESDTMSDDGRSVANSDGSGTTVGGGRRRRRSLRTSTSFHLAHPAPTLTQKQRLLHIRPKLLLQLQRLSADSRHKPAIDVLPSTVVVPRLVKRFPRMFRGKGELGANDVMVVRSEEYDLVDDKSTDGTDSDEEGVSKRDLMAVICQMRKDEGGSVGKAEIVLNDGSVWIATPLPNGLYEFVTVDERGDKTTARWVRRSSKRKSVDLSEAVNNSDDYKFTFSIIDPTTRRHPILATITQNKLDIPDYYTTVSSSAGKYPPCSPIRALPEAEYLPSDDELPKTRTANALDENIKILIQVTGIWVALRQGWSPYFKYNDTMTLRGVSPNPRIASHGRVRSLSLTPDAGRPYPAPTSSSTPESSHSNFGSLRCKGRRPSVKGSPTSGATPQSEKLTIPKRSVSTGTAFMQRAVARRTGNPPSAMASESEAEGVMAPPKRSATDYTNGSFSQPVTTPPASLRLPGSAATTPDTPTRPQRRVQSVYLPPSALQNPYNSTEPCRLSVDVSEWKHASTFGEKPKLTRWKAFTNFFRRTNSSSRAA